MLQIYQIWRSFRGELAVLQATLQVYIHPQSKLIFSLHITIFNKPRGVGSGEHRPVVETMLRFLCGILGRIRLLHEIEHEGTLLWQSILWCLDKIQFRAFSMVTTSRSDLRAIVDSSIQKMGSSPSIPSQMNCLKYSMRHINAATKRKIPEFSYHNRNTLLPCQWHPE